MIRLLPLLPSNPSTLFVSRACIRSQKKSFRQVLPEWATKQVVNYFLVLLLAGMAACATDATPSLTFCEEPTPCPKGQTDFLVGQSLYVHLASGEPLVAQQIVGSILRVTDKDTASLGSRTITLTPNQQSLVQSLPFHEFGPEAVGTFLIRFTDEDNQLIAEKNLHILPPQQL